MWSLSHQIKLDVRRSFRPGLWPFDRQRMSLTRLRQMPSPDANTPNFQTAQMPASFPALHHSKRRADMAQQADLEARPEVRPQPRQDMPRHTPPAIRVEDGCRKESRA